METFQLPSQSLTAWASWAGVPVSMLNDFMNLVQMQVICDGDGLLSTVLFITNN